MNYSQQKRILMRCLAAAFLLFSLLPGVEAQSRIKGLVHLASDTSQYIANVPVFLLNSQGTVIDSMHTDSLGRYDFVVSTFGTYSLDVRIPWDFTGVTFNDILATVQTANSLLSIDSLSFLALDLDKNQSLTISDANSMLGLLTQQIDSVPLNHWVVIKPQIIVADTSTYPANLETIPPARRRPTPIGNPTKKPQLLEYYEKVEDPKDHTQFDFNVYISDSRSISGFYAEFEIPDNAMVLYVSSEQAPVHYIIEQQRLTIHSAIQNQNVWLSSERAVLRIRVLIKDESWQELTLKPVNIELIEQIDIPPTASLKIPTLKAANPASMHASIQDHQFVIENCSQGATMQIIDLRGVICYSKRLDKDFNSVAIPKLPKGYYCLLVNDPENKPFSQIFWIE